MKIGEKVLGRSFRVTKKSKSRDFATLFGETMRDLRIDAGVAQNKASELSGLSQSFVSRMEKGQRNIGLRNLVSFLRAIDFDIDKIGQLVIEVENELKKDK
jgi:transcriptional regulator with XRE-family HTH domain